MKKKIVVSLIVIVFFFGAGGAAIFGPVSVVQAQAGATSTLATTNAITAEILKNQSVLVEEKRFLLADDGTIIIIKQQTMKLPMKDYLKRFHGSHQVLQIQFDFWRKLVYFFYTVPE